MSFRRLSAASVAAAFLLLLPDLLRSQPSTELTPLVRTPDLVMRNVAMIPSGSAGGWVELFSRVTLSVFEDAQRMRIRLRVLSDGRTVIAFPDNVTADESVYSIALFDTGHQQVWRVQHPFGSRFLPVDFSFSPDRIHLLGYRISNTKICYLVRCTLDGTTGRLLDIETLARREQDREVTDTAYYAPTVIRSNDSSRILVCQVAHEFRDATFSSLRTFIVDSTFTLIRERTIPFGIPVLEIEGERESVTGAVMPSGVTVDNDGGIYLATIMSGRHLDMFYAPPDGGPLRGGRYTLNHKAFTELHGRTANIIGLSQIQMRANDGEVVVTAPVAEPWYNGAGLTYGLVSVAFPRATMSPRLIRLHVFNDELIEVVTGHSYTLPLELLSVIPLADGSEIVTLIQTADAPVSFNGLPRGEGDNHPLNRLERHAAARFSILHYNSDGTLRWARGYDDGNDEPCAEDFTPGAPSMRMRMHDPATIDILYAHYPEREYRTLRFDATRDTLIFGRPLVRYAERQRITRQHVFWSGDSRMVLLVGGLVTNQYNVHQVSTADGSSLFAPCAGN